MRLLRRSLCLAFLLTCIACSGDNGTEPLIPEELASLAAVEMAAGPDLVVEGDGPFVSDADQEFSGDDGPFEIHLASSTVDLTFRVNSAVHAREPASIILRAVPRSGSAVPARVTIDFGDGRRKRTFEILRKVEFEYTFRKPGKYRVFAVLRDASGAAARGGFRLLVGDRRQIDLQVQGIESIRPSRISTLRFVAADRNSPDGSGVGGELFIDFGNGTSDHVQKFDGDVTRTVVYHLRSRPYILSVRLITDTGLELENEVEVWADHDAGPTGPTGPVAPVDGDAIDLSRAVIAQNSDQGVAGFRVTSEVTGVSITPSQICISHTMAGRWPSLDGSEGNPWIAAYLDGQLHAGTFEYLRTGQVCKSITAANLGDHIKYGPLGGYYPRAGDVVYLFVSTLARLGYYTSNERSNVVEAVWPY